MNKHLKKIGKELKSAVSSIFHILKRILSALEILKYPVLVALFWIDCAFIMFFLLLIAVNRIYGLLGLALSQSVVIYLVVKEGYRRAHLLPPSEVWETTSDQWSKPFAEYVEKVRRKNKRV